MPDALDGTSQCTLHPCKNVNGNTWGFADLKMGWRFECPKAMELRLCIGFDGGQGRFNIGIMQNSTSHQCVLRWDAATVHDFDFILLGQHSC